jgi:hypothetical protein
VFGVDSKTACNPVALQGHFRFDPWRTHGTAYDDEHDARGGRPDCNPGPARFDSWRALESVHCPLSIVNCRSQNATTSDNEQLTIDQPGSSDPLGAGTGLENQGAPHGAWQVRLLQLPLTDTTATVAQPAGGTGLRNRDVWVRIPPVALKKGWRMKDEPNCGFLILHPSYFILRFGCGSPTWQEAPDRDSG